MKSRLAVALVAAFALVLLGSACSDSGTSSREVAGNGGGASVDGKRYSKPDQVITAGKKYEATIVTDKGSIVLQLLADKAPRTVNTFVFLAQKKFYDGVTFHRVVKDSVISIAQGGDPTGRGNGGPGFELQEDQNDLSNLRGSVSMAKVTGSLTVGSQFFINLADNTNLDLNAGNQKRFYPFAQVISGLDVADQLVAGDVMRSVTVREVP